MSVSHQLPSYESYAAHFGSKHLSSPASSSYTVLQNLQVYLSDSISKVVSITQAGEPVTAEKDKAFLHLQDEEGILKIYLPKSRQEGNSVFLASSRLRYSII
jgi:hypothetical protein